MVWTSDQTAALIGGQQQMQLQGQQMAQSIGSGLHLPMPTSVHGLGSSMAGGALSAMAAPTKLASQAAGIASLGMLGVGATGFMGGKLGLGVTGRGLMGSFGGMGGGALGAAASLPMFAGTAAAAYGANQMVRGYRESQQVGSLMNQSFSFANANAYSGQGFSSREVGDVTKTMRGVATQAKTSMDDIMSTFQSMNDMGMMQTVRSAKEFETKFKGLMDSVKKISHTFSTSMKEAAELLGSMRSSGLYSAQDVLGGTLQRSVLGQHGLSAQQVTGQERAGAGIAASLGARRGTGARTAVGLTGAVGTAASLGILSSADLLEATGTEGADAYAALGQSLAGAAFQFTQGSAGKAMMAYAGEMEDGRFTSKMNQSRMDDITSGRVGMDEILAGAAERTSGSRAAASFKAVSPELSGNFAQSGGNEAMMSAVRGIVEKLGSSADEGDMVTLVMDKIAGVDRQTARILVKMSKEHEQIQRERARELRQSIDARARDYERTQYRSWEGLKSRMKKGWRESIGDPLAGVSGDIGTSIQGQVEDVANAFYGRYQTHEISGGEMDKLQRMGSSGRESSARGILVGQDLDLKGFSEGTRRQLLGLTGGMGGSIKVTEGNVDRVLGLLQKEQGMGAGIGVLSDVGQAQVTSAARGLGSMIFDKDIATDKAGSAESVLSTLLSAKDRSSGQQDALDIVRQATGVSRLGNDGLRNARVVLSDTQRGKALEAITATMRGGGMSEFGGGTFRTNALEEMAAGQVDERRAAMFNDSRGAYAARGFMGVLGGTAGGVGTAWTGLGAVGGAGAAGLASYKLTELAQEHAKGTFAWSQMNDWGGTRSRISDIMGDSKQRDAFAAMVEDRGSWAKNIESAKMAAGGGTVEGGFAFSGEDAGAVARTLESLQGESGARQEEIRGTVRALTASLVGEAGARTSIAIQGQGAKLLAAVKEKSGGVWKKVKAYAKARAAGREGAAELKAIVQAMPQGDDDESHQKRRSLLEEIGALPGGSSLKASLEAYLAVKGQGTTGSITGMEKALRGAGVAEGTITNAGIGAAFEGGLTEKELGELAVSVGSEVSLADATGDAAAGGTKARSMHVETAMMTRMESMTTAMNGVLDQQGQFNTLTQVAITNLQVDAGKKKKTTTANPDEDED